MAAIGAVVDEEKLFQQAQDDFFSSVRHGKISDVAVAIDRRPLKNFRGEEFPWLTMTHLEEQTAFHIAAEHGHARLLEVLASKGADANAVDLGGETALHLAANQNHTDALTTLLELGVPIDARNKSEATALYGATSRSKLAAMRLLLEARAAVDLPDRRHETPLGCAARGNSPDAAAILLAAGASLRAEDRDGKTPMHHCVPNYTSGLTHLFWFHAATLGDVAALRRLLSKQIGSSGDEGWHEVGAPARALFLLPWVPAPPRALLLSPPARGCMARIAQPRFLSSFSFSLFLSLSLSASLSLSLSPPLSASLSPRPSRMYACHVSDSLALHRPARPRLVPAPRPGPAQAQPAQVPHQR